VTAKKSDFDILLEMLDRSMYRNHYEVFEFDNRCRGITIHDAADSIDLLFNKAGKIE